MFSVNLRIINLPRPSVQLCHKKCGSGYEDMEFFSGSYFSIFALNKEKVRTRKHCILTFLGSDCFNETKHCSWNILAQC